MKQLEIQEAIQEAGYNVVTCGDCGCVFFHEIGEKILVCPHCDEEQECSDAPDLFYPQWSSDINK